jgi:hypothetical protein
MELKVVLRFVPTRVKAAIAATAINAAISAYSIAVTPDLSLMRFEKNVCNRSLFSACL